MSSERFPHFLYQIVFSAIFLLTATVSAAELPFLNDAQMACQKTTFNATRTYANSVFVARQDCFDKVTRRILSQTVDCLASVEEGTGSPDTDTRLHVAEAQFSKAIATTCLGITLEDLGFPGFCTDEDGPPYTAFDHERCLITAADTLVEALLDIEHPPFPGLLRSRQSSCQDLIARRSSGMFVKEIKTRTSCVEKKLERKITDQVDCRREDDPLDPATGDDRINNNILSAHKKVLSGIANNCQTTDVQELGFPHLCPHPPDSVFALAALTRCMFDTHHANLIRFMDIMSPTTSVCGNGELNFTERCDDGDNLRATGELCRKNCTLVACGDPDDSGAVSISDALFVLRAAVGLDSCALEVCDVDNSGGITVVDALRVLQRVVGLAVELACPFPISLTCGNGIVDGPEQCDDGDTSWMFGQICNASCQRLACGDVNGSETISVSDAVFMLRVVVGLETCDLAVCDVNDSGTINTADVLRVLRKSTGQNVSLTCPF